MLIANEHVKTFKANGRLALLYKEDAICMLLNALCRRADLSNRYYFQADLESQYDSGETDRRV
jgi:hypothetical protein